MSAYNLNPLYPKPAILSTGGSSQGQRLAVTSGSAVQFAAFDKDTSLVVADVTGGTLYVTFDGQTPSATVGNSLYVGDKLIWSNATATAAKFIAASTSGALYAHQFQV